MRKFLCDPDPAGNAGGGTPPNNPPADDKKKKDDPATPPTSADTGAGGKTAKEIALEKRVATLEDDKNTLTGRLKVTEDWIAKQITPAPAAKEQPLLEQVNQVLGWGVD